MTLIWCELWSLWLGDCRPGQLQLQVEVLQSLLRMKKCFTVASNHNKTWKSLQIVYIRDIIVSDIVDDLYYIFILLDSTKLSWRPSSTPFSPAFRRCTTPAHWFCILRKVAFSQTSSPPTSILPEPFRLLHREHHLAPVWKMLNIWGELRRRKGIAVWSWTSWWWAPLTNWVSNPSKQWFFSQPQTILTSATQTQSCEP